jgi:flagellin-like hook-associated protein FlgL
MRDALKSGSLPTDADTKTVTDFNSKLLNVISTNGDTENKMTATNDLLDSQTTELTELMQNVSGVDEYKLATDLQNQQYQLELAYKTSSMILPKSILDYL